MLNQQKDDRTGVPNGPDGDNQKGKDTKKKVRI
jgi:hypothetical protein